MKTLIYGAGGFGKEVLWLLTEINERLGIPTDVQFVVDDEYTTDPPPKGIIRKSAVNPLWYNFIVAIGNPRQV